MLILRGLIVATIVVGVSILAERQPRWGAFLLTLPLMSILAFALTWQRNHDLPKLQTMARETLVLVPLGLPFFVPMALAERLGLSGPQAMLAGLAVASATVGAWLRWGPAM